MSDEANTTIEDKPATPARVKIRRHSGSIMILALISMIGLFALVTPPAISGSLEKNTDNAYDSSDTYDLKMSYALGFTDSDITALQYAECIDSVSPDAERAASVSQDSAIDAVNVYPELYVHVSGAKDKVALSDSYAELVSSAREYIETNIEPSQSVARAQYIRSGLSKELSELNAVMTGYAEKDAALDEELITLSENYVKAMADFESEQQSINEAKSAIQAKERNAQSTIESGKKNLTSVLNEVYSKSVVTAADIKKAQGLSNYVSGSEKSLHSQFTSEWAELADIETHLHEDEVALQENKEARELEIAEEKKQLVLDAEETQAKITALEEQMDVDGGRWIIEDRSIIPAYEMLALSDSDIKNRYAPIGIFIYLLCLAGSVLIAISIVTRNKARIISWKQRGLEDRIISELFIRRIGLASAIGALIGAITAGIISPIAYMYSYADVLGIPFTGFGISLFAPVLGITAMVAVTAAACLLTYRIKSAGYSTPVEQPSSSPESPQQASAPAREDPQPAAAAQPQAVPLYQTPLTGVSIDTSNLYSPQELNQRKGMLKIDMLQEDMLNTYGSDEPEKPKKKSLFAKFKAKEKKNDALP